MDVDCFLGSSYSGIVKPGRDTAALVLLRHRKQPRVGRRRRARDPARALLPAWPAHSRRRIRCDVLLLQVSPPNARGEYSLGLAADYLVPALDVCRAIVAEVNAQVPWTHTERLLAKADFDLVVETSRPPAVPPLRTGELELAIARNAVPFIPDGAVLEFGIGACPTRCALCSIGMKGCVCTRAPSATAWWSSPSARSSAGRRAMLIGSKKLFDCARENERVRLQQRVHARRRGPGAPAALRRHQFRGRGGLHRPGERRARRRELRRRGGRRARLRARGEPLARRRGAHVLARGARSWRSSAAPSPSRAAKRASS